MQTKSYIVLLTGSALLSGGYYFGLNPSKFVESLKSIDENDEYYREEY